MKRRLKEVFLNRKESIKKIRESIQEVYHQNDSSRNKGQKK